MEGSENGLPSGPDEPMEIPVEDPGKDVIQPVVMTEPPGELLKELSAELPEALPDEPPHQLPSEVRDEVPGEVSEEVPEELPNAEVQGNDPKNSNDSTPGSGSAQLVHSHHSQASLAPAGAIAEVDGAHDAVGEQVVAQGGDKRELTEAECEDELGYAFPCSKKWMILIIMSLVQFSMDFNTSIYSSGISGVAEEFDVTHQVARYGAALFLVTYAVACELWAPWSEELGRWRVLEASLTFINVSTIVVCFARNVPAVLVGRALGGLSTAGGSVTFGLIADLYDSDNQQYAVALM